MPLASNSDDCLGNFMNTTTITKVFIFPRFKLCGPVNLRAGTNFIPFCTRLSIYERLNKAEKEFTDFLSGLATYRSPFEVMSPYLPFNK